MREFEIYLPMTMNDGIPVDGGVDSGNKRPARKSVRRLYAFPSPVGRGVADGAASRFAMR